MANMPAIWKNVGISSLIQLQSSLIELESSLIYCKIIYFRGVKISWFYVQKWIRWHLISLFSDLQLNDKNRLFKRFS